MSIDEIKNSRLKDLILSWENDFRGAVELYEYNSELEIIDGFMNIISETTFNGDFQKMDVKIRYEYYDKFAELRKEYVA